MTNHLAITCSKSEKVNNILTCNQAFFIYIFVVVFRRQGKGMSRKNKHLVNLSSWRKKTSAPDIFALRKIKTQLCSIIVSWKN